MCVVYDNLITLGICIGAIGLGWYLGVLDGMEMTILLLIASVIPIPCLIIANKKHGRAEHDS